MKKQYRGWSWVGMGRGGGACPIGPFRPAGVWRLRQSTWACSRSLGWATVVASSSGLSFAPLPLSPSAIAPPSCPSPQQRRCCHWPLAAVAAVAAAVVSVLWTRWRMMACRTSGRGGCCYDGRDGCGVTRGFRVGGRVHESVRTAGWSRGTAACPGPVGSVWCRSSWVSSWVSQWAAEVWQKHDKQKSFLLLLLCCHCNRTGWSSTARGWCWGSGPGL